jgi:hypothetical protein
MIPSLMQDCLVNELETLFYGFTLKNVNNEDSPLHIYPQGLPSRKNQNDTSHYPFVVVKLIDGEDPGEEDPNTCRIFFICGIYDPSENLQGHKDCLNILQKIYAHLARFRVFDKKYEVQYPFNWNLTDEDYFPYFYGGIETTWTVGKITMQDDEFL